MLGLKPAREFDAWLDRVGLTNHAGRVRPLDMPEPFQRLLMAG
jgi:hypothetical protein